MPTRKIRDLDPTETCRDPEHNPPSHMVFTPGIYEHECPTCGKTVTFTVRPASWSGSTPYLKNENAVQLGRLGGLKGGPARANKLTSKQRSDIARKAAIARWHR